MAPTIVPQLMEFLSDASDDSKSAVNVILFVREAFESLPELRTDMLQKLLNGFGQIRSDRVVRAALWILGEYAASRPEIDAVMEEIKWVRRRMWMGKNFADLPALLTGARWGHCRLWTLS